MNFRTILPAIIVVLAMNLLSARAEDEQRGRYQLYKAAVDSGGKEALFRIDTQTGQTFMLRIELVQGKGFVRVWLPVLESKDVSVSLSGEEKRR